MRFIKKALSLVMVCVLVFGILAAGMTVNVSAVGDGKQDVDNNTYTVVKQIKKDYPGKYETAVTDTEKLEVKLQGRNVEIILTSESFDNGKIYNTNIMPQEFYVDEKSGVGIINIELVDNTNGDITDPDNHVYSFDIFSRKATNRKEYISLDEFYYSFSFRFDTTGVTVGDDSYIGSSLLVFNNHENYDFTTDGLSIVSEGNTITFKFTLPESMPGGDQIEFDNKNMTIADLDWQVGLNPELEELIDITPEEEEPDITPPEEQSIFERVISFFNNLSDNSKSFFSNIIVFFKNLFKFNVKNDRVTFLPA